MSFAEDVKNELCAYEPETDTDVAMKIEASCLLRMGGSLLLGMRGAIGIRLATANNAVARRLLGILKKQYELPTHVIWHCGLLPNSCRGSGYTQWRRDAPSCAALF